MATVLASINNDRMTHTREILEKKTLNEMTTNYAKITGIMT